MPPSNSMRRAALAAAAVGGGVMVAMIVEIMLARRGILLVSVWQNIFRGGTPLRAAIAWWAITGGAFVAGFVLALAISRLSWLYFRSLRFVAACGRCNRSCGDRMDRRPRAAAGGGRCRPPGARQPRGARRRHADGGLRGLLRGAALEHIPFLRNRDVLSIHALAHVLFGEPVPTPDQVRGRLSPGHAPAAPHGRHEPIGPALRPIGMACCQCRAAAVRKPGLTTTSALAPRPAALLPAHWLSPARRRARTHRR